MNWLLEQAHQKDHALFLSPMRRFLQNVASLTHVLKYAKQMAIKEKLQLQASKESQVRSEQQLMNNHQKECEQAFESYYQIKKKSKKVKPLCGDYLHTIAHSKQTKL